MKFLLLLTGLLVGISIDVSFSEFFAVRGVVPSVVLLMALYACSTSGMRTALFFVFGSFILNMYAGIVMGVMPLALLCVVWFMELVSKRFFQEQRRMLFGASAILATLIWYVAIVALQYLLLLVKIIPSTIESNGQLIITILIAALANGIIAIILFSPLKWYFEMLSFYGKQQLGTIKRYRS